MKLRKINIIFFRCKFVLDVCIQRLVISFLFNFQINPFMDIEQQRKKKFYQN